MGLEQYEEIQNRLWNLLKRERDSCQTAYEIDVRRCRPTTLRETRANVNQADKGLQLRPLATIMGKRSDIRKASVRLLLDVMRDLIRSHEWSTPLPAMTVRDEPSELHRISSLYAWLKDLENDQTTDKVPTLSDCHIRKPLTAVTDFHDLHPVVRSEERPSQPCVGRCAACHLGSRDDIQSR
jgi:hypothetical protein